MVQFGKHFALTMKRFPQWQSRFIPYRTLKKVIKKIKKRNKGETFSEEEERQPILGIVSSESFHNEGPRRPWNNGLQITCDDLCAEFVELISRSAGIVRQFFSETIQEMKNYWEVLTEEVLKNNSVAEARKLRQTVVMFAKKLTDLKFYHDVNTLAVRKIVKKYNKNTSSETNLDVATLICKWDTAELDQLHSRVESLLADQWFLGDLYQARRHMGIRQHVKFTHWDTFMFGMFFGFLAPVLVILFIAFQEPHSQNHFLTFRLWVPMYRLAGTVPVVLWMWGFCCFIFDRYQVNHVYILQLHPVHHISWVKILQVAAMFTVLWAFVLLLHIQGHTTASLKILGIPAFVLPLVPSLVFLFILFLPLNVFCWETRISLITTLKDIISLPFGSVGFRQFFLGDQLTSITTPMADALFGGCVYYRLRDLNIDYNVFPAPISEHVTLQDIAVECSESNNKHKQFVMVLPFVWRLVQCMKMYKLTRNKIHIINSGKYLSFILAILFGFLWANFGTPRSFLVIFSFLCEIYAFGYDLLMDWGLIKGRKRRTLVGRWWFGIIIPINFLIRFQFVLTKSQGIIPPRIDEMVLATIFVFTDILRRSLWNVLRMDNEMVNNLESYRSIDYVPSPMQELGLKSSAAPTKL